MLSLGIEASLALEIASASAGFPSGSPPPSFAATVIARVSFVKSFPRRASTIAFLCLIPAHFECPAMALSLSARLLVEQFVGGGAALGGEALGAGAKGLRVGLGHGARERRRRTPRPRRRGRRAPPSGRPTACRRPWFVASGSGSRRVARWKRSEAPHTCPTRYCATRTLWYGPIATS